MSAELRRLLSVRTSLVFAVLLVGACVGPIILMTLTYDPAYRGPIEPNDLGKCALIFHVVAIVFVGTHTVTELRSGSFALNFLTQPKRLPSLFALFVIQAGFLLVAYIVGMSLAIGAASLYPDGVSTPPAGWIYLVLYSCVILAWALMCASLAIITRTIAIAAAPLIWMLLIEPLSSMLPMLDSITPWMPYNAGTTFLNGVISPEPEMADLAPFVIAVLVPTVALVLVSAAVYHRRDLTSA